MFLTILHFTNLKCQWQAYIIWLATWWLCGSSSARPSVKESLLLFLSKSGPFHPLFTFGQLWYLCITGWRGSRRTVLKQFYILISGSETLLCIVVKKIRRYSWSNKTIRASFVVTPDFRKKTRCISYVRQDQIYTHMIDVISENIKTIFKM